MPSAVLPVPARTDLVPADRSVTVLVAGGLDGALRVAMLLRSRGYRVPALSIAAPEATAPSRVTCTVVVTDAQLRLLLARLHRLPAVITADAAPPG